MVSQQDLKSPNLFTKKLYTFLMELKKLGMLENLLNNPIIQKYLKSLKPKKP